MLHPVLRHLYVPVLLVISLLSYSATVSSQQPEDPIPASNAFTKPEYSDAIKAVMEKIKHLRTVEITPIKDNRSAGLYDDINNAFYILQNPTEAMKGFPLDRRLQVDWVKTLNKGMITPRASLDGSEEIMEMEMEIVMKNTRFMPYVRFPHLAHTQWLDCSNCHPKIFQPQQHANPVTMNKVLSGEYCGICHGKVSFSTFVCERCHSIPHEGSGPAWWKESDDK